MARPQVYITEESIPAAPIVEATGRVAYVVESEKGEAFKFLFLNGETVGVNTLGKPTADTVLDFTILRSMWAYMNDVVVVRAVNEATAQLSRKGFSFPASVLTVDALNGGSDVKYFRDYRSHTVKSGLNLEFYAKSPSVDLNKVQVAWCKPIDGGIWANNTDEVFATQTGQTPVYFNSVFDYSPNFANQEIHLVVIYDGQIVERWNVSLTVGAKNLQNQNIFITDVLAANSSYINGFVAASSYTTLVSATAQTLDNGTKGNAATTLDIQNAYAMFAQKNDVSFDYIIDGRHTAQRSYIVSNIAEYRKDCVAVIGTPRSVIFGSDSSDVPLTNTDTITANTITDRYLLPNSSWTVYYSNWKETYDKYLDKNIWIPITGDIAAHKVRLNTDSAVWIPPAGNTNGQILNVLRLAFNPSDSNQDDLYKNQINHVIFRDGVGFITDGQKTLEIRNVGVARWNIRDLFRTVEKFTGQVALTFLHEFNDEITRARFVSFIEPYLSDIQAKGGLVRYQVVCDDSNNTSDVINAYGFRAYVKLEGKRAIENITIKFFDVPAGVDFNEVS